mgnify:CR=1 FL=1
MTPARGLRSPEPLVLGIETSCDETGVGMVRGTTLLVDAIASSVEAHARYGGVVPEVASRAHLEALVPTLRRACDQAGVTLAEIDAIAVTAVSCRRRPAATSASTSIEVANASAVKPVACWPSPERSASPAAPRTANAPPVTIAARPSATISRVRPLDFSTS